VTDQALLSIVQRRLVETATGGQSYDSQLWTAEEVHRYVEQAQDRLLAATHAQVGIAAIAAVVGQAQYALPIDWLCTVSVDWQDPTTLAVTELPGGDTLQADCGIPTWPAASGTPRLYADAEFPTRTIQLMPAPDVAGTILVNYVPRGAPITGQGSLLTVPDELVYTGVLYGVLGAMLGKVGRAADPARAGYCRSRMALAQTAVTLLLQGFPHA
jgi:hypothetical protein